MTLQKMVQRGKGGSLQISMFIFFVILLSASSLVFAQTTDEWDNDGTSVFVKPEFESVSIGRIPLPGEPPDVKLQIVSYYGDPKLPLRVIRSDINSSAITVVVDDGPYAGQISMVPHVGNGGHNSLSRIGDTGIFFIGSGLPSGTGLVIGPSNLSEHAGAMRITYEGNIGIGISEPKAAKLHVLNLNPEGGTAIKGESKYLNGVAGRSISSNGVYGFSQQGYGGYFHGAQGMYTNKLVIGQEPMEIPAGYDMAVDGKILVEEVTCELSENWSDFVFDEDYSLMPLSELEQRIKKDKHLPGIPTAKEVEADGVSLGAMQSRLLQKIEELTLYVIDLKKENEALKERVGVLENGEH